MSHWLLVRRASMPFMIGWLMIAGAEAQDALLAQPRSPAAPERRVAGQDRSLPANQPRAGAPITEKVPLPIPAPVRRESTLTPPGLPPRQGSPRPGSIFDPGATGPGISQGEENFLDGALDPRTGWPFVFLDHFKARPDRVEQFWIVSTRDCPQEMGTDPWPRLRCRHFDDRGELVEVDAGILFAQSLGKPVFIQVQGSLTTPDVALGGLLWSHSWLQKNRAMLPETIVIAFDWPSQRVYRNDTRDINEKGRRAYVAGYHLARFVNSFPSESRICLLGQSYGGRVVLSALHLLGGGALNSQDHDPPVHPGALRSDLQLHATVLAAASDRTWLDPGARLDRVLHGCAGLLNLYNPRDEALRFYPLLFRSGHHHALGRVGLSNGDFARLGALADRYAERNLREILGREHTLLDAVANPQTARLMAPYLWAPDPGPSVDAPQEAVTGGFFSTRFGRDPRRVPRFRGTAN